MIKSVIRKALNRIGVSLQRANPSSPISEAVPLVLPKVSIPEAIGDKTPILVLEPEASEGNVSLLELLVINTLVAQRAPKFLFEIGTFDGRTSMNMAANAVKDAALYTLDLPKEDLGETAFSLHAADRQYVDKPQSGRRFAGTVHAERITQLYGDSAKFDFSPYYGKMEVIFIDGSHAYDYVKSDTAAALKLAADSALIIWHDYHPFWKEAVQALEELQSSGGVYANLRNIAGTTLVILELSR